MAEGCVEAVAARIYRRHGIALKEGRKEFMKKFAERKRSPAEGSAAYLTDQHQ